MDIIRKCRQTLKTAGEYKSIFAWFLFPPQSIFHPSIHPSISLSKTVCHRINIWMKKKLFLFSTVEHFSFITVCFNKFHKFYFCFGGKRYDFWSIVKQCSMETCIYCIGLASVLTLCCVGVRVRSLCMYVIRFLCIWHNVSIQVRTLMPLSRLLARPSVYSFAFNLDCWYGMCSPKTEHFHRYVSLSFQCVSVYVYVKPMNSATISVGCDKIRSGLFAAFVCMCSMSTWHLPFHQMRR